MRIVEILTLPNSAHRNMTYNNGGTVPEGWAIIPDDMECENFPFGNLTVDEQVPPVVTSWEPLPIPEPDPEPEPVEPETDDVTWDAMATAITEGVNEV